MTVAELAAFSRRPYQRWDDDALAARVRRFEIPTAVPFRRLSKGQKTQVALSLALASLARQRDEQRHDTDRANHLTIPTHRAVAWGTRTPRTRNR